jgi:hypothetical protein
MNYIKLWSLHAAEFYDKEPQNLSQYSNASPTSLINTLTTGLYMSLFPVFDYIPLHYSSLQELTLWS